MQDGQKKSNIWVRKNNMQTVQKQALSQQAHKIHTRDYMERHVQS